MNTKEYIELGKVGRAKGLRGLFFVTMYHEHSDFFDYAQSVYVGNALQELKSYVIASSRMEKGRYVLGLQGIDHRDLAEDLLHQKIYCQRQDLAVPEEDEFYIQDLINLNVYDEQGKALGVVKKTLETGTHEVLSIIDGDKEWMCPFNEVYVVEVDMEAKKIIVRDADILREI